jgi:hypothetical protein
MTSGKNEMFLKFHSDDFLFEDDRSVAANPRHYYSHYDVVNDLLLYY